MKRFLYWCYFISFFTVGVHTIALAQPKRVLLSMGLSMGPNTCINQFAKPSPDNIYGGQIISGGSASIFLAYHLSKEYRLTGNLDGRALLSKEISEKLDGYFSGYQSYSRNNFGSLSLSFGLQKNIYFEGADNLALFSDLN